MGNCLDCRMYLEPPESADVAKQSPAAKEEQAPPAEKPRPMVFAPMRNGHEVIRGSQRDLRAAIEEGSIFKVRQIWRKLSKWMDMHMLMEEGDGSEGSPIGVFNLLDKHFDNIATNGGLFDDHGDLHKMEQALQDTMGGDGTMAEIKVAFEVFEEANLAHLKKEESIMMPCVSKMAKSGKHNMKQIMREEILAAIVGSKDFEFWIKYANEVLERHPEGMPRVRVFDHALWAIATPAQWKEWDKWIKDTVSAATYKELHDAIGD